MAERTTPAQQAPPHPAPERVHASTSRLAFLDWTRGAAAVIMLQGHVFHSFLATDLREGSPYILSQFLGGMPPAYFLFLTGVTFAFLLDSLSRRVPSAGQRFRAALLRARYLFVIAFLFRIQMWLFGLPYSQWVDIFKMDILNSMGATIAALSFLVVFDTRQRVVYAAVCGAVFSGLAPLVTHLDWSGAPKLLEAYLKPDPNTFSLFPWAAFLAFGVSAGSIMRLVPNDLYPRMLEWFALGGLGLILLASYFSQLPYSVYERCDFWLDSPGLVLVKTGVVMVTLSLGFLWTTLLSGRTSWVALLGQHSLPVYWLHIELVYGRWFGGWKESLSTFEVVLCSAALIVLMIIISHYKGRFDKGDYPGLRNWVSARLSFVS
ncbi:MAG: hypothetical protein OHK0021_16810 [Bryobacter sp.]